MDFPYLNIECPSDDLTDMYSIFKYQISIWEVPGGCLTFKKVLNIRLGMSDGRLAFE